MSHTPLSFAHVVLRSVHEHCARCRNCHRYRRALRLRHGQSLAVKGVASTLSEGGDTVTSHDDPDLIAGAMPFALMLHESLLASVPTHEPLLTTTCSLYTQYAFGFVAADAETLQRDDYERSKQLSDRAFKLAERGRNYCWRGLEVTFRGISRS